jgi:hypothetical protein
MKSRLLRKEYLIIASNSTSLFVISYLILWLVLKVITAIAALAFGIHSVINYDKIDFLIRGSDWTGDAVQIVFSAGPVAAFIISLFLLILYGNIVQESGRLKLLIVWALTQSWVMVFGDMLMGAIFNRGLGYVLLYLFVMDTGKMVITLIGLVVLFFFGLSMSRFYLYTANSYYSTLNHSNRTPFIIFQYIVPFVAGNIIIILLKLPGISVYEIFVNLTMAIFLIPLVIRSIASQDLWFDEEPRTIRISWRYAGSAVTLLILYRVLLSVGIRF